MKQIILGTAGHIDHGKTSLIKALTGINTDRLKEEQIRGITIELGFASMRLPSGQQIGIVDVPGHEKFVKNMVAGATGIDLVAMVIAADEGVMPQTREHMEICSLLGISHGMVVLTKIDLVDEEWLELVKDDVDKFVKGTFLEKKPVVPVSSATGQGLDEFIKTLDELSKNVPERPASSLFRLPVDRVFTMKGFGTVITGTMISGHVSVGATIMIYPSGITSKVRGLQVHNESVNEARAGMRTAINFQGIEKTSVLRGDVVSMPGELKPSYMLDVFFHYLAGNKKSIKNRTRVRFHAGTGEILANIVLLDSEELEPGQSAIAQLRLESPVVLVKDDRFVVRSYSPIRTIGGGQIINPIPQKHKRFKPEIVKGLNSLVNQSPEGVISHYIDNAGLFGVSLSDLKIMTNIPEKELDRLLQEFLSKREALILDKENRTYVHSRSFDDIKKQVSDNLAQYHKENPLKAGMPKEELKSKFQGIPEPKLFTLALNRLIKDNEIVQTEETVRLSHHKVSLAVDLAGAKNKILEAYQKGALTPPYFKDLTTEIGIDAAMAKDVLNLLIGENKIIKVKEDLYFYTDSIKNLKDKIIKFFGNNTDMTTAQFKDMTGLSRKYLIPLLEYFDSVNLTIRVGDIRKLRSR